MKSNVFIEISIFDILLIYFLRKQKMKKISIVIPVYNAATTLDRCLKSIFVQNYPELQIIAVNDASTDNSLEVLKNYACKHPEMEVYSLEKNSGVSAARNFGLTKANGFYLQFVDADDDLDPKYFEKMIHLIESTDSDMAVCRYNHLFFKTYLPDRTYDLSKKEDLLYLYQDTYGVTMPWNRLWKRECFTRGFDVDVHFSEDDLCNLSNLHNVKKAVSTSEYLYHYFFATKEETGKEDSAVNNIINSEAFWNNKTSFYYLGALLYPKRRAFIEEAMKNGEWPSDVIDMAYYRVIDYCFWQMPAYIGMGIPEEGLAIENWHIFEEPLFQEGYKEQEKYGLRVNLKNMKSGEIKEKAAIFTKYCYQTWKDKAQDPNFEVAYAFIDFFLRIFATKTADANPVNYNIRMMNEMEQNSTAEAKYVNSILK